MIRDMSNGNTSSGNVDKNRLSRLLEQFRSAAAATAADRTART
jgi:hypothetical protein